MASRFLGLARDAALASAFGAAAAMDAFLAAFRLPNTLRRFTAEGALTQAFVPSYQRARMQDAAAAAAFAGDLLFILAAFLLTLTAAAVLAAPFIIGLIAPGLAEPALAADLLRAVFPYIFFISLAALFAGMLNAAGRFRAAAAAPMLLSVCLIAARRIVVFFIAADCRAGLGRFGGRRFAIDAAGGLRSPRRIAAVVSLSPAVFGNSGRIKKNGAKFFGRGGDSN